MLETEDRPAAHDPMGPHRRSPGAWLLVAAAVAVVAVVGALLVAAAGDDDESVPATETPTTTPAEVITSLEGMSDIEPGRYIVDPDLDETTPLVVTFEVADEGWSAWSGTYKRNGSAQTAINITTIDNLVVDGCTGHRPADPPVGPGVDDLATALAALQPFEVTAPPTDVTLLGYKGKHLQLAIPAGFAVGRCTNDLLESWISPYMGGPFTGYNNGEPGRTQDFWILDVDGQRLVIETNEGPASSAEDRAQRDAIFESIRIDP